MTTDIVPLNKELHGHLRVKDSVNFGHVAQEQLIPVVVHEFVQVASEFPIAFAKDAKTGQFVAVALMGLKSGENLYCGAAGWDGLSVPSALRNHPFSLGLLEEGSDKTVLCINEASELVNAFEGEPLFDENGEQTEYLRTRTEAVVNYVEQSNVTKRFVEFLVDKDLLVSQDLSIQLKAGEKFNINGIYIVDEKKLKELDDEEFNAIRIKGFLPAIYAHLISLQQLQRLTRKKVEMTSSKQSTT